jgi:hypothetical protein
VVRRLRVSVRELVSVQEKEVLVVDQQLGGNVAHQYLSSCGVTRKNPACTFILVLDNLS